MKIAAPLILLILIILLTGLLLSCSPARKPDEGNEIYPGLPQKIIPSVQQNQIPRELKHLVENGMNRTTKPRVPLDTGEKLYYALNTNLDLDMTDEQILVLRGPGEAEAPIKIAVVDFDSVRGNYSRTWESETSAYNIRTFTIVLKDLVGDHNQEIVCRGMNIQGELTLDVFRKTPSPTGLGLYFRDIARIISDGSIEIQDIERSESYRMGQKNGRSFPIFSYTQDRESENILDRIKHSYYWQYQQNRYVLSSVEKLPGAVIEEKQLEELFSRTSTRAFEDFLSGPWFLSNSKSKEEIILFIPSKGTGTGTSQGKISFFSGAVQETYDWKRSFHSLSNRLTIYMANETIQTIEKRIWIEVKSLNTIDVSILGSEPWDRFHGSYVRLNEELQHYLIDKEQAGTRFSQIDLSGLYRSDRGIEIIFEPPKFTWIEAERQFSGGFAVFRLNKDVLYLKGMDENGLATEDKTYIFEFTLKEENKYLYRTITLVPGCLSIHGVEPVSEEKLIFKRIEAPETEG